MSWIEKRLAELANDGFFDELPGSGEPIADLAVEYSPTWWVSRWTQRDAARQSSDGLRARLETDIAQAAQLSRPAARERLQQIKAAVDELNHHLDSHQRLPKVDVEDEIIRWTARRG